MEPRRPIPLITRLSLRAKVTGLLLVLSLAPLLVAGLVNVHRAVDRGKHAERERYSQAARTAAQAFGALADRTLAESRVLARRFPVDAVDIQQAIVRLEAGDLRPLRFSRWTPPDLVHELNDSEITTLLAASDGRVLHTVPFRHTGALSIAALLERTPRAGGLVTGRVPPLTDGLWPALVAISPVIEGGQTVGWVGLMAHGTRLSDLVQSAASDLDGTVGVFDLAGHQVVIAGGPQEAHGEARQWIVPDDSDWGVEEVEEQDATWLVAWARVPGAPLTVQTRVSVASAYKPVYILIWLLTAVIMLTFLLVLVFADYLSTVLLRPIQALERGAEMIGAGALHHRINVEGHQNDELGRLANAFNQMGESLQESEKQVRAYSRSLETANAELDALVHGVTHDMRKSLRTIEAFATFLEEDYNAVLGEDGAGLVHGVLNNVHRIEQFTNDIARLVQRERDRGDASKFDFRALLNDVCVRVLQRYPTGVVEFDGELPRLHADRAQLVMLFDNLIDNGLKFNESPHPTVTIRVGSDALDWRIEVRDNGIGIDPSQRASIFELFGRLHRQTEYPGTGTGLTLARRIVEDHRGTITIESALGEGATFVVTLPKQPQMLTLPGIRI